MTSELIKNYVVNYMCNFPLFPVRPFIISSTMSFAKINQKLILNSFRELTYNGLVEMKNQVTWKQTRLTFKLPIRENRGTQIISVAFIVQLN